MRYGYRSLDRWYRSISPWPSLWIPSPNVATIDTEIGVFIPNSVHSFYLKMVAPIAYRTPSSLRLSNGAIIYKGRNWLFLVTGPKKENTTTEMKWKTGAARSYRPS